MDKARSIESELDLREVMRYYGIDFNLRGFARCPFHHEKTASLTIKNNHYKCFGCGEYGGVIDFVMNYFNLTFKQALVRIDSDFSLGLTDRKPARKEQLDRADSRRVDKAHKKWKEELRQEYSTLCEVHACLYRRYLSGDEGVKDFMQDLETLLDLFDDEEARRWRTM